MRLIINARRIEDLHYNISIIKKKDIVNRRLSTMPFFSIWIYYREISEKKSRSIKDCNIKLIFNTHTYINNWISVKISLKSSIFMYVLLNFTCNVLCQYADFKIF